MRLLSLPVVFIALSTASQVSANSLRDTADADGLARRALAGSLSQKGFEIRRRSLRQHHDLISKRADEENDDVAADSSDSSASASATSTRSRTTRRSTSTRRTSTRTRSSESASPDPTTSVDDSEAGSSSSSGRSSRNSSTATSSSTAALSSVTQAAASSSRAAAKLAAASSASEASLSSASAAAASSHSLASVSSIAAANASSSLAEASSVSSAASASSASLASASLASVESIASASSVASLASASAAASAASAASAAAATAASETAQDTATGTSPSSASSTEFLITTSVDGGYTVITSYQTVAATGGVTNPLKATSASSSDSSLSKGAIVAIAVSLGTIMLLAVVFTIIRKRRQALSRAIRPLSFDPTPNYGTRGDTHSTHRDMTRTSQESWLGGRPMSGVSERDADILPPMTEASHGNRVVSDGYSGGYTVGGITAAAPQYGYAGQDDYAGSGAHYDGSNHAGYQTASAPGYGAPAYPEAVGTEVTGYADLQRGPSSSSGHSHGSYGERAYGMAYGGTDRPEDDPFQYPSSSSRDAIGTTRWSG
ncbi:hypothetical protein BCV69DRAFT_284128 [Microstroma glucosiphilum]|uniref:REJ domain-containing protein n=1 Tax=Pseudomicrostroma glucosiphilum TaxID=1684307 RepID=A0A316U2D7_9BASI|nr:hypothetical protein BCV69DRAFT_284128 [Pseudomicrostroma glucosiphilum]PWN19499.1 hypothetical protein BCV69DRAFT_284128 [Pseudomicrostroma glucosiphilum]